MGLADRLAAAKQERLGGAPSPTSPTQDTEEPTPPVIDLTEPDPLLDLTGALARPDSAPPATRAGEDGDADELVLDDGFAATDPNAVLAWSPDEGPLVTARTQAADEAEDDLNLADNDSWARAYRQKRKL